MPLLDVSEILADPDFAADDGFAVTRRVATANTYGETTITETAYTAAGVVLAGGGDTLTTLQDAQQAASTIEIYTPFKLVVATGTTLADLVEWQGTIYVVSAIQDWGAFGAGFYHATCTMRDLLQQAPA